MELFRGLPPEALSNLFNKLSFKYFSSFKLHMREGLRKYETDIYNFDYKIKKHVKNIEVSKISNKNKKLIFNFMNDMIADGLSKARILKYLVFLKKIIIIVNKDFDKITEADVKNFVMKIETENYSLWTKHDYKVIIKKFIKWIKKTEEYPKEVSWLKTSIKQSGKILPEDILTPQEIIKLIKTARNARDKALVSILYESGMRIKELLTLKIRHIEFDSFGARIICNGKTGMRRIRIVSSVVYLKKWLNEHQMNNDLDCPLWLSWNRIIKDKNILKDNLRVMGYRRTRDILKDLAQKCKIQKRVNPHSFRHARATHLANKLTEAQMKEFFGWTQSSEMASIYVHLSGRDTEDAILKIYGKKKPEKADKDELSEKICQNCRNYNLLEAKFCEKCGFPLELQTAIEMDSRLTEAIKHLNNRLDKLESNTSR